MLINFFKRYIMKSNYNTDIARFQNNQTRAKLAYNLQPEELDGFDGV